MGGSKSHSKIIGKSSQNSPIGPTRTDIVYSLLTVVSHYDLSVLSMSVLGFQQIIVCNYGCGELKPFF